MHLSLRYFTDFLLLNGVSLALGDHERAGGGVWNDPFTYLMLSCTERNNLTSLLPVDRVMRGKQLEQMKIECIDLFKRRMISKIMPSSLIRSWDASENSCSKRTCDGSDGRMNSEVYSREVDAGFKKAAIVRMVKDRGKSMKLLHWQIQSRCCLQRWQTCSRQVRWIKTVRLIDTFQSNELNHRKDEIHEN